MSVHPVPLQHVHQHQQQQPPQPKEQQQQQQHAAPQAPAAPQPAAAQLRRCRSLSELLRVRPCDGSAVARSHWARLWGFDPSPLEFGSPPRAPSGRRSFGRQGSTLADYAASSYGGTSSYGGSIRGGASFYEVRRGAARGRGLVTIVSGYCAGLVRRPRWVGCWGRRGVVGCWWWWWGGVG